MADPIGPENGARIEHFGSAYDFLLLRWGSNAHPAHARLVGRRSSHVMTNETGTPATMVCSAGNHSQPRRPYRLAHGRPLQSPISAYDGEDSRVDPRRAPAPADITPTNSDLTSSPRRRRHVP